MAVPDTRKEFNLLSYAKEDLNKTIDECERLKKSSKKSLKSLVNIDLNNSTYKVRIKSQFERDGEISVDFVRKGTLSNAVIEATGKFEKVNHRKPRGASYDAKLKLAGGYLVIPEEYLRPVVPNFEEID